MNPESSKRRACALAFLAASLFAGSAAAAPIFNPDNSHFYEVITSSPITWENAKVEAESLSFFGLQGHLATITSQAENDFLRDVVGIPNRSLFGGYQPDKSDEPAGGWAWVTGETWSYTNWSSPPEPNNAGGFEDCVEWWTVAGKWNDIPCNYSETHYIVEYEGGVEGQAIFVVTKVFSDGNTAEVDVTLTCNTGLPLEQNFTIAGGDPAGVAFVVTDIPESGADCSVSESGGPANYTPEFNGGAGCAWEDVSSGARLCEITNTANPATFTVVKEWLIGNTGGDLVIPEADVTIECDSPIAGGWEGDGTWYLSGMLGDGDDLVASVDVSEGPADCSASEEITQSGVESASDGCGETQLTAGGSHTCRFTNTVFFEGIPTLSQYGLAILVLLTLGIGMIGFRRYA